MKHQPEPAVPSFSPFWPFILVVISVIAFMSWQISIGVRQYLQGVRFAEQQELMASQAADVEAKFQALIMDVLELAKNNPEVDAVVRNYNIRFTPSAAERAAAASEGAVQPGSP